MSRRAPDDDLRRTLRRGDPADDGRDPDATELAAWRGRMLAQVQDRHPSPARRWIIPAAGAALACALLIALALRPGPPAGDGPGPRQTARAEIPAADPLTGPAGPAPPAGTAHDAPTPPPAPGEAPAPAIASSLPSPPRPAERPAAGRDAPEKAAVAADRRQLQFTAPGGTRIIWTLDPRFHLQSKGDAS